MAKHARASHAQVTIARQSNLLVIEVSDDGIGGAERPPAAGWPAWPTGRRVGGWVRVLSPVNGPTIVLVELPCGS